MRESKRVIIAAFAGNLALAVSKFVAAGFTGSSAMLSEGVHSVVDTGNQLLLLLGISRASRPPDERHPFGYGMEIYFWTFVVAILIFAVGSGISFYEGFRHLRHPEPIENAVWNYAVLSLGLVFEGVAWTVAYREFNKTRGGRPWLRAVRLSKDPTIFTVLFEDTAAMLGLLVALAGVAGAQIFAMPVLDAAASIGIGVILAGTAILLAIESKGLLIGEGADPEVVRSIRAIIGGDPRIAKVNEVLTMHLAPRTILVAASLDFTGGLSSGEVEEAVTGFEQAVKRAHPRVGRIFIEAQHWRDHRRIGAAQNMER